jgi:hypothetical protein
MAVSRVEICNMALARIGVSAFIEDIDSEPSTEAQACRLFFDAARDRLLAEFNWPFARRYAALQLIDQADDQPWANDWPFKYQYPPDCIAVRRIVTALGPNDPNPPPFDVGEGVIYTNQEKAIALYTARVVSTAKFPPLFVSALAWLLAWELGMPLAVDPKMRAAAIQGYNMDLSVAAAKAANESQPHEGPDPEFIRARG